MEPNSTQHPGPGRRFQAWKMARIALFVFAAAAVLGFVVEHLWNWLVPTIFGLTSITFWQALGLLLLGKILFGGFHRHGGGGGRRDWKRHMGERWASMTPAEREQFQARLRGRGRGCWPGRDRHANGEDQPMEEKTA